MKKFLITALLLALLSFSLSASDFSFGISGNFGSINTNYDLSVPGLGSISDSNKITQWAVSTFFDLKLADIYIGLKFHDISITDNEGTLDERNTYLFFGVTLKYPFVITKNIEFFPYLGFDYSRFMNCEGNEDGDNYNLRRGDLHASDYFDFANINLGLGLDYIINSNFYIRGQFHYTFQSNSDLQEDLTELYKKAGAHLSITQNGPVFYLAVGYRL